MSKKVKLIVKSNYIVEASYKLSLGEQRVIYVLTSMINPMDEEFKPYKLTVKEFAEILGTKSKNMYSQVALYVDGLRDRDLTIIKERSVLKTKWLSSAEYFRDEGYVELCFDPKLKPYLLMLKERFTKLSLEQMVSFGSRYSGRIYELLKQYQKVGGRVFKIEDLRPLLGIKSDEYTKYGLFKQRILNKSKEEINSLSDLIINFEEIKKVRKVEAIRFIIKSKFDIDEIAITSQSPKEYTDEKSKVVRAVFDEKISFIQVKQILDVAKGNVSIIKDKYKLAQKASRIIDIVAWMIDAIKNDYQAPISKVNQDTFNNYEQRTYDYVDLEKKLLGWKSNKEDTETEYEHGKTTI